MGPLPTRRLIEATAKLTPADRALLNLWLNRGLDEQRLSQLTGMRPEVVVTRRARLIERLSEELTLPPDDVRAALAELAAGPLESGNGNGALQAPGMPAGALLGPAAVRPASPAPRPAGLLLGPAAVRPAPQPAGLLLGPGAVVRGAPGPPAGPPRRRVVAITGGLAALVLAVILVLTLTGGSGAQHRAAARAKGIATKPAPAPAPTPAPPTPTTSTPVAARSGTRTGPVPGGFAGLPGGLRHAHGSVQLVGPLKHLKLRLRVRRLPSPHRGHYEVWLFNSVLDSTALGRLRGGKRTATYELPPQARRYRWIDISLQPRRYVNHSGESVLRASNPAHTTRARLRKRSARRRHHFRRAGSRSSRARTSK
jgi:hypothetical protein